MLKFISRMSKTIGSGVEQTIKETVEDKKTGEKVHTKTVIFGDGTKVTVNYSGKEPENNQVEKDVKEAREAVDKLIAKGEVALEKGMKALDKALESLDEIFKDW